MKEKHKRQIHAVNQFLNRPIAVIITIILLFVYFVYANHQYQVQNHNLLVSTNANTTSTNQVVKGQSDILNAIKQLALDTKLDSNEKTNIIICMLQVPVSQRTTDLQEQCRADVENSLSNQTTSTNPGGTTTPSNPQSVTNKSNPSPTGQPAASPAPTPTQSQAVAPKPVQLLGIPVCVPLLNLCLR